MQLSSEQLSQFYVDGFIVLRGFVGAERCDAIFKIAQVHLDAKIEPIETEIGYGSRSKEYRTSVVDYNSQSEKKGSIVRRLRQVYTRDALFKKWMEEREIRPILQQVLDDEVVLITAHHNSIMTKLPQISTATAWHQDRRYWQYTDDNLVSVWLALDDENSENGALEFIPGSHKESFGSAHFDEKEYFSSEYVVNQKYIKKKVTLSLNKGDVVLFHSLLLHCANKNTTDKPKISFVYTVKGKSTEAIGNSRSAEFPEIYLDKI